MKKIIAFIIVLNSVCVGVWAATEKTRSVDENHDGRNETVYFYDEYGSRVRAEVDQNNDGKTDRWVKIKNNARFSTEIDRDFDGQVDTWEKYDSKGTTASVAADTNHDGKPDQFKQMLKGRNVVLVESDRNADGKIDQRRLTEWGMRKLGPGQPQIPAYITTWEEDDNNFDGKIDVYKEKGNKNPDQSRIGKAIEKKSV